MEDVKKICAELNLRNWDRVIDRIRKRFPKEDPVGLFYHLMWGVRREIRRPTQAQIAKILNVSLFSVRQRTKSGAELIFGNTGRFDLRNKELSIGTDKVCRLRLKYPELVNLLKSSGEKT